MPTVPNNCPSETTGAAVRRTKFDVAHSRHKDVLLRVNQINDSKDPLCDTSKIVYFLIRLFCAFEFDHSKGTFPIAAVATATRFEES